MIYSMFVMLFAHNIECFVCFCHLKLWRLRKSHDKRM